MLFAISNSGKSRNILNAIKSAYDKGIKVILLGGKNIDNQFSKYIDIEICVPYSGYLDYIQEIHVKIIHVLILIIENKFHYEDYLLSDWVAYFMQCFLVIFKFIKSFLIDKFNSVCSRHSSIGRAVHS